MFEEESVEGRILLAAKELFSEKGHEETTLREIADKAKTSESQILRYFHSKAGVLDALFDLARAFIDGWFDQILKETNDPVVVLESVSTLLVDFYQRDAQLLSIYLFSRRYYTLISDPQLLKGAKFRKQIAEVIRKGQKKGMFRNDLNPEAGASALWGAMQGVMRDKYYAVKITDFRDLSQKEIGVILETLINFLYNSRK